MGRFKIWRTADILRLVFRVRAYIYRVSGFKARVYRFYVGFTGFRRLGFIQFRFVGFRIGCSFDLLGIACLSLHPRVSYVATSWANPETHPNWASEVHG